MTLTPLIVALCVNAGPTYNEACRNAAEQGAAQSGLAGNFEKITKKYERDVVKYIDPSKSVEITAAAIGYVVQLSTGHSANFSVPNPVLRNSSLNLNVGKDEVRFGVLINF